MALCTMQQSISQSPLPTENQLKSSQMPPYVHALSRLSVNSQSAGNNGVMI